ncbi:hypothetical protein [Paraburkholderia atlantica]|uniref:hypothetical protein n=1 Tax=Paraburkholderia atlantica TaxID=2654982 RepID=UPI0016092DE3|nr:hypothetical protein [Paraburkholderia atlantica]MBB5508906.1 hypothetical protein [Paraburkholderia atlantica]
MTTFVTYDTRSGKIISVHHGATDVKKVRQRAHDHSKIDHQHIDVIPIQLDALQREKRYKVDHASKTLVEAPANEGIEPHRESWRPVGLS